MTIDDGRERDIILGKIESLINTVRSSANSIGSALSNLRSEINTILPSYPTALSIAEKDELKSNLTILEGALTAFQVEIGKLTIKR